MAAREREPLVPKRKVVPQNSTKDNSWTHDSMKRNHAWGLGIIEDSVATQLEKRPF